MVRIGGEAARRHRLAHALQPAEAGGDAQSSGDRSDPPVAEIEQVVGRLASGRDVVDRDRVEPIAAERAAEQDLGRVCGQRSGGIVRGGPDRHQHHAVAAQGLDAGDDALLGVDALVRVEDDQRIAGGRGGGFGGADDPRVERVGEIGHRDRDQLAATAPQDPRGARGQVGRSRTAFSTRAFSSGETYEVPFSTAETVAVETRAALATSRIVAMARANRFGRGAWQPWAGI